jgi:heme-degrading monooxygenase HmoA
MYLAMNHFRVTGDNAAAFEKAWRERESFLAGVPGFLAFHLMRGPAEPDGAVPFASHTTWESEAAFVAWTRSEAFRRAHAQSGAGGLTLGPPRLATWTSVDIGAAASPPSRRVQINGTAPSAAQLRVLEELERSFGFRLPDGAYWYDARSGAAGQWGGPASGVLPAGLDLGPAMPAHCSGGGTQVFINGRELHVQDVMGLQQLFGMVMPGRYFVDERGNGGFEGGPPMFNLLAAMQQAQAARRGGAWSHTTDVGGSRMHVGGDGQGFTYFMDSDGHSFYSG